MARANNTPMQENAKKAISENLVRLMKVRGMTQVELSDRTGIPATTINGYVKGTSLPTPGNTEKLSQLFNVTKDKIDPRFNSDAFKRYDFSSAKEQLSPSQNEFFEALMEKALSLDENEREDFFKNVRFAVEFFDKNKK